MGRPRMVDGFKRDADGNVVGVLTPAEHAAAVERFHEDWSAWEASQAEGDSASGEARLLDRIEELERENARLRAELAGRPKTIVEKLLSGEWWSGEGPR